MGGRSFLSDIALQIMDDPVLGGFLVVSAGQISCDELVRVCRVLGVICESFGDNK